METVTSMLGAVMLVLAGVVVALALVIVALHEARYIVRLGSRLRRGGRGPSGHLADTGTAHLARTNGGTADA